MKYNEQTTRNMQYIDMHIHSHTCTLGHTHTHILVHTHTHTHTHTLTHIYSCTHTHNKYTHACIRTHTNTRVHTHTYTHITHTHPHTHTRFAPMYNVHVKTYASLHFVSFNTHCTMLLVYALDLLHVPLHGAFAGCLEGGTARSCVTPSL